MVRIAAIEAGSIAEKLELEIGTRIIRINGETVRDGIDLAFLLADEALELETVGAEGERAVYEIERAPGEAMGIVPAPDTIRECANECVFCFIDGNPEGARESLGLRDDDFRLSFTYGSYVTLTNLGPRGLERLVEQRISPLYVSVHATEPDVRIRLLKNDRAGLILDQLRMLGDGGLEMHTQVVLCPEWNDGDHLDRTIEDLYDLGDSILSLSVVPVGLTRYNMNRPVRPVTRDEVARAIEQTNRPRQRALAERGHGWCYAADEMYLLAGEPLPDDTYYDDWPLTENGVGAVKRFIREIDQVLAAPPNLSGRRLNIVTGRSMEALFTERLPSLAEATGAEVDLFPVTNEYFGASVTVAGLLGGDEILKALPHGLTDRDAVLLPGEALNADGLFIDNLSLDEFCEKTGPATVTASREIAESLHVLCAASHE
ncbi:MAG: DUF512 domain-containing protein [Longimicrobiales bacterium]